MLKVICNSKIIIIVILFNSLIIAQTSSTITYNIPHWNKSGSFMVEAEQHQERDTGKN